MRGALLAVLAALSFGLAIPIVERAGRGSGAFTTASLLYAGAALSSVAFGRLARSPGAPLRREHVPRLLLIALFGAAVAPSLLAWGLQRGGATTGSLLLNLEAVFTVLLARAIYREPIGRRVALALASIGIGGLVLTLDAAGSAAWNALGAVAIAGATVAWALDNTLTRALAELDPVAVVGWKGVLGAVATASLALVVHEHVPRMPAALVLLACGATGYGLSLRLYLQAQRCFGAARTGSIFALAPFIGASFAWVLGDRSVTLMTGFAAGCFVLGVFLHVTERHRHLHVHVPTEHEHSHHHHDGHHDHVHDPRVEGEHSHTHRHEYLEHDHEHAPDVHHSHSHGRIRPPGSGETVGGNPADQTREARSRSAFPMTETELKLMAAAAIIGLRRRPKTG